MTTILGVVESDQQTVTKPSLETLTLAREVAAGLGAELHAAVVGGGARELAGTLGAYGVSVAHELTHPLLDDYAPAAWAAGIAQLAERLGAVAVMAPGSDRGNETLAHVAARDDLPLAAACVEVEPGEGDWRVTRHRWGGMLLEDAQLSAPLKLLTVAPHAGKTVEADAPADITVATFAPELGDELAVARVTERVTEAEGVTLATAPVVVSGGRGVGSAEGFKVLEELAELLGGAVGCSRVATNNGWRPHADQVGQTGTRVAPDLYVACGISGATQHWVGCMGAKRILAVNTDPEAPLVTRADYAVIGDVHEVLPAIVAELRARRP